LKGHRIFTSHSMSRKNITSLIRRNRWKILSLGFILTALVLVMWWSNTPRSTLKWANLSELGVSLKEVCAETRQIYPQTSLDWPFPVYSPDKNYYIDIENGQRMRTKWIKIFRSDVNQEIGTYYSSFSSLLVHCWDKDSSGIYISDYEPGSGGFDIGGKSSKTSPVKKLLVP